MSVWSSKIHISYLSSSMSDSIIRHVALVTYTWDTKVPMSSFPCPSLLKKMHRECKSKHADLHSDHHKQHKYGCCDKAYKSLQAKRRQKSR